MIPVGCNLTGNMFLFHLNIFLHFDISPRARNDLTVSVESAFSATYPVHLKLFPSAQESRQPQYWNPGLV